MTGRIAIPLALLLLSGCLASNPGEPEAPAPIEADDDPFHLQRSLALDECTGWFVSMTVETQSLQAHVPVGYKVVGLGDVSLVSLQAFECARAVAQGTERSNSSMLWATVTVDGAPHQTNPLGFESYVLGAWVDAHSAQDIRNALRGSEWNLATASFAWAPDGFRVEAPGLELELVTAADQPTGPADGGPTYFEWWHAGRSEDHVLLEAEVESGSSSLAAANLTANGLPFDGMLPWGPTGQWPVDAGHLEFAADFWAAPLNGTPYPALGFRQKSANADSPLIQFSDCSGSAFSVFVDSARLRPLMPQGYEPAAVAHESDSPRILLPSDVAEVRLDAIECNAYLGMDGFGPVRLAWTSVPLAQEHGREAQKLDAYVLERFVDEPDGRVQGFLVSQGWDTAPASILASPSRAVVRQTGGANYVAYTREQQSGWFILDGQRLFMASADGTERAWVGQPSFGHGLYQDPGTLSVEGGVLGQLLPTAAPQAARTFWRWGASSVHLEEVA